MQTYANKQELLAEIKKRFEKYEAEFDNIPESLKDHRIEAVDKTPSENLAYQLGWINLLLTWEAKEKAGQQVITPTPEYKWNNLGGLYQTFYEQYGQCSLAQQRSMLIKTMEKLYCWIASLTEEELFQAGQRNWATTKAMWPVYKWIHINTVAPFTNFRSKIRKWKKLTLAS